MKKLLIITYYWPPAGGSGVQRWLYFVKHLRLYGWEPIVYTVENGEYPYLDEGLQNHIPEGVKIIRRPIMEPYDFYRKLTGKKQKIDPTIFADKKQGGLLKKISIWVRGNLFIPDPRRFWIKPSVRFLAEYLSENPVDAIVSTGPPHSMHLIARNLKRKMNIPWLADFRDPWTQIYFFDQMYMSAIAKMIHRKLELSVLKEADAIVTVSNHCKTGLQKIYNRNVEVITNGFEEFELKQTASKTDKIRMLYAGVLSLDRNPALFWRLLDDYLNTHPQLKEKFELWIIGNVDQSILDGIKSTRLGSNLHALPSIAHKELQSHLSTADILLLIGVPGDPGVVTGKFFEYLYLRKPIYSISPDDSDVVVILNETQAGFNADFRDENQLQKNLVAIFDGIHTHAIGNSNEKINTYSRKSLTGKLAQVLDQLINKNS